MSNKIYCDRCEEELSLPGNSYSASQVELKQFKLIVAIHPKYSNNYADLCTECVKHLAREAFGRKL